MHLLGASEPRIDQFEIPLTRRNAPRGLLLEAVQDVDGFDEPDGVDAR